MGNGFGDRQEADSRQSKRRILKALEDGERHRYGDIQERTKLGTATLSKHLKTLQKGLVERWYDSKSKEYPHPVWYRLKPSIVDQKTVEKLNEVVEKLKPRLIKKEGIAQFLHNRNVFYSSLITSYLISYFKREMSQTEFGQALEYIVFTPFREDIEILKETLEDMSKKRKDIPNLVYVEALLLNQEYRSLKNLKV